MRRHRRYRGRVSVHVHLSSRALSAADVRAVRAVTDCAAKRTRGPPRARGRRTAAAASVRGAVVSTATTTTTTTTRARPAPRHVARAAQR